MIAALLLGVVVALVNLNNAIEAIGGTSGVNLLLLIFSAPKLLIALLLWLFVPIYIGLGFFYGWRRALASVVASYSGAVADRFAGMVAKRLVSMPKLENAASSVRQWADEDNVSQQMETAVGSGKWARRVTRFVTKRLPWNKVLADWKAADQAHSAAESLQALLSPRIARAINEAVSPSWLPLGLCVGLEIALLVTSAIL
ncbi:MAG: hypothetical protein LBF91_03180 [Azoarcus sp.]|nr:hypothetical protein [Azoarcus sp.]